MGAYKTLDDLGDVTGKRVLVRVDFNVPLQDGAVSDATRIDRALPTITELADKGARVLLLSHMGRPKGEVRPEFSLSQIMPALKDRLSSVRMATDCVGDLPAIEPGEVLLLENVRFYKGEESNDADFAKALAGNGDIYINDAFSCAHRAHASTEGIAHILPSFAGRAMQAELEALSTALDHPTRPVIAFVGGAKISTKLDLLSNLADKVDMMVIGGGMANTFLNAQGKPVGKSLCEHDLAETAREILTKAKQVKCQVVLPTDVVVAAEFKAGAPAQTIPIDAVGPDDMILDLGTDSLAHIASLVDGAKTVVWNGPLGAFEIEPFDNGTNMAARHVALLTKSGRITSVAGGGDTVAALNHASAAQDFTYVSTAGGAFLEWLEGKALPGVTALNT